MLVRLSRFNQHYWGYRIACFGQSTASDDQSDEMFALHQFPQNNELVRVLKVGDIHNLSHNGCRNCRIYAA